MQTVTKSIRDAKRIVSFATGLASWKRDAHRRNRRFAKQELHRDATTDRSLLRKPLTSWDLC